ncbi:MAG: hypothetical protein FJ291_10435 [Planctomycetes bacterium]|nr:hypothetical protein [Planctomycetota bacterium]
MSEEFDPAARAIVVGAQLWGPAGDTCATLALDTGATTTIVGWHIAALLGYSPAASGELEQLTTASGVEFVPKITVARLLAIGQERVQFPVLCHTLPPSARVDGLLGLDFLRGRRLVVDFRSGLLSLD